MSRLGQQNPYKILGLSPGATQAEVKRAYFTLVREHPPERDPEGFKRVRAAYEKLRSEQERAETDLFLIDDQQTAVEPQMLNKSVRPAALDTTEAILTDLIAMEACLLLERLSNRWDQEAGDKVRGFAPTGGREVS